ncbi:MAG: hypothetical protein IT294_14795 [Deltaproteobacteria bacterium]|nr:hypothetical protein [Deltaproteobacteria bacterium]
MTSRVAVRIVGLALAIGIVWYITAINAENARLRSAATNAPAASAERAAAGAAAARSLTGEQRQAMLEKLQNNPGRPVWFATVPNNPEAAAYQKQIQSVFEAAGWEIKSNSVVRFPMKPGIFVFAADEEPPGYLASVNDAFEAAGIAITSGRGYREFVRAKKEENKDWLGLELGPEDVYVVAVGRAG